MSHYVDEDGLLHVVDETLDTDVVVFAKLQGGVLHVMGRAKDENAFVQEALTVGLVELVNDDPALFEGNELMPAPPPSDVPAYVPVQGATINGMGAYMTKPPGLDQDGNPATPPAFDDRWHFNFWLDSNLTAKGTWEQWIVSWMEQGTPGNSPNENEHGKVHKDIELMDPSSIKTPGNVLL